MKPKTKTTRITTDPVKYMVTASLYLPRTCHTVTVSHFGEVGQTVKEVAAIAKEKLLDHPSVRFEEMLSK